MVMQRRLALAAGGAVGLVLLLSCLSPAAAVRWAGAAILLGQGLSASRVTLPRNVQGGARADIAQGGVGEGRAW
jgi:hypothetical protein